MEDYKESLDFILGTADEKAALTEQNAEVTERTDAEDLKLRNAMRAVFKTEEGAVFLRFLLEITQVYSPLFSSDARYSAFMEGRRSVGLILLKQIADMDGKLLKMLLDKEEVGVVTLISTEGS